MQVGSTLNEPLDNLESVLKSSKEKAGRKRVVFFISDRRNNK